MVILCKAIGMSMLTGWLYYQRIWAVIIILPFGIWVYGYLQKEKEEQKKGVFLLQFKEMVESLSSALNVGYSVENAFREVYKEMKILYPEKSLVIEELEVILRKIQIQIPIEQILEEFAKRVQLEDVQNFVSVFSAAKRSGGDMIEIIRNTSMQIGEKIDVKREIDIIISAKKYEFHIMCLIPYAMILYMQVSFPEFMDTLYGNAIGTGVMTVCLAAYITAYVIGAGMTKIEV